METISNLIEKTKETIGLAEPHDEAKPLQQQNDQKINDEQDLDSGHTVLETVKDTILSVVEKTKEMLPFGSSGDQQTQEEQDSQSKDIQQKAMDLKDSAQQKASDVKENVQQKFSDLKESAQQKTGDMKQTIEKKVEDMKADNTDEKRPQEQQHHHQGEERITQKMKNWNESLQKLEEQHHQPLTKAHETHESKHEQFDFEKSYGDDDSEVKEESSSSSTTATTTEGIQQKIIDLKDATTEKLTQAKDVVLQKGAELKETLSNAQTQVFNKLQGEGEEVNKKDVTEGSEEQHTGLVAAVSGVLHNAFDAGKGLIEKAKDSISDLTTGTANTEGQEPIDNNNNNKSSSDSGVASSMKNTASMVGDKVSQLSESAAAKVEKWTENTLGDVSVVDPSDKNKQHMSQPGQPKEMGSSNVQPTVSKSSESAA